MILGVGDFCFLKDQYFIDFPEANAMRNKNTPNNVRHKRPYFIARIDSDGIYWLIPISSKILKYRTIYDKYVKNGKKCHIIKFEHLLSKPAAFLIQNIIPSTINYIDSLYLDSYGNLVHLPYKSQCNIIKATNIIFHLIQHKGFKTMGDISKVRNTLLNI